MQGIFMSDCFTVTDGNANDHVLWHICMEPMEKTPTPVYEQQWAPNIIQTIIMICNAKGIPIAIAQKL